MKNKLFQNLSLDGRKLAWYVWQLLPCRYFTHYRDGENRLHFCDWRMWFGKCFFIKDRVIVTPNTS